MASSGILRRVALVRTDVSEEISASIIRVTRIGELRTLAVTSNRRTLRRNTGFFAIIFIVMLSSPVCVGGPLYPQKLTLNFVDKWRSLSRYSSLAD
jgi:hypothetical protein